MFIRQQAFTGENKLLKGALHCHTTRSDGKVTPEDVIRLHKANEYDFMAITDHNIYNYKNYAEDIEITIIPGMEVDNTFERIKGFRTFHHVCLGPDDETNGYAQDQRLPNGNAKDQYEYQPYLDAIHANNNITFYCHPEWSSTPPRYFDKLKGNVAMEIWNSGGADENYMDTNALYWDDLLGQGIRLWGVATDDGHQPHHHCKGWVMVNAENNVKSILEAIKDGKFYSSCGPIIKDFYFENGNIYLDCEPVEKIYFLSDCHPTEIFTNEGGQITHAETDIDPENYKYIRAYVIDKDGKQAWTNPIFFED